MFIEPPLMAKPEEPVPTCCSNVVSPQFGALNGSSVSSASLNGVLLVTVTFSVSPAFTCSVGFSRPSGVMKQNSCRPTESVTDWYENCTFKTPFWLNSAAGLLTTLPAARRGHGLRSEEHT